MDYVVALLPSIGLAIIFVVVLRAILFADRRERAAIRELEKKMDNSASLVAHDDIPTERDNSDSRN
ncbi:hypothetical protein SAMN05216184_102277 [Georgenia satyanarayanai]|uniref:Uncharacterized protein n=1 Tax=Georgenia satyanarayanai TaxID=860221 RepID=A0A2Y9A561_9MICO|nr:hypothetical protein [Georgenia satyanarayanai]PYG01116.1 hypothetical protein A8987_102277 [Georgenia satyanarayanai]SSA39355.1 hypothetical protein SAMN05216184_102277 [Georgenia satyanarayanai]